MSVLFPKVNKPRQWDYRPIYFDPEKEERKEKLAKLQAERERQKANGEDSTEPLYQTTLHRGSFREARSMGHEMMDKERRRYKWRLSFWIMMMAIIFACVYVFVLKM